MSQGRGRRTAAGGCVALLMCVGFAPDFAWAQASARRDTQTEPPSQVTSQSAVLNGILTAAEFDWNARYSFRYGTDQAAVQNRTAATTPQRTASVTAGGSRPVSEPVSGLKPDTVYYVRLEAVDGRSKDTELRSFRTARPCSGHRYNQVRVQVANAINPLYLTGCFEQAPGAGPLTATGAVVINGVEFRPVSDKGRLTVDPGLRKIATTGAAYGTFLAAQALHADSVPAVNFELVVDPSSRTLSLQPRWPKVGSTKPLLGVRWVNNLVTIVPAGDPGATLIAQVALPLNIGGSAASLRARISGTGALQTATASLGDLTISALKFPASSVVMHDAVARKWSYEGSAGLPLLNVAGLRAKFELSGVPNSPWYAPSRVEASVNSLNLPIAPPAPIFLQDVSVVLAYDMPEVGGFPRNIFLGGHIGLSASPKVMKDVSLLTVDAKYLFEGNRHQKLYSGVRLGVVPGTYGISGELKLLGISLRRAEAKLFVSRYPVLAVKGGWGPQYLTEDGCTGLTLDASVVGEIGRTKTSAVGFNLLSTGVAEFKSGIKIGQKCLGSSGKAPDAQVLISDRGIAVCSDPVKMAFKWPRTAAELRKKVIETVTAELFKAGTCQIKEYTTKIVASSASAEAETLARVARGHARSVRIRIPRSSRDALIRVRGRDRAPAIAVEGPGLSARMTRESPVAERGKYQFYTDDNLTFLRVIRPKGGVYRVSSVAGAAPFVDVRTAGVGAPAKVNVRVRRRGQGQLLIWRSRKRPGQSLQFRAVGAGEHVTIGRSAKRRGTLPIRGLRRGRHRLLVDVLESGFAAQRMRGPNFNVGGSSRPSAPSGLRMRRVGAELLLTWSHSRPKAETYEVTVAGEGLPKEGFSATTQKPRVRVPLATGGQRVTVRIVGVSATGTRSRALTARRKTP